MNSLRYWGESWGWEDGSVVKEYFWDKHEYRNSDLQNPCKGGLTVIPVVKTRRQQIPRPVVLYFERTLDNTACFESEGGTSH